MILNRIVSPIYREFLTKISRPGVRSGRCWRISNTQTDVTLWCHVTFWPHDSNAIFEDKIAQLPVKLTNFIVGNSNFEIVYFKRYIFILCGKIFRFIGNLKCQISEKAFCPKNDIIFVAGAGAPPSLPPTARTPLVIWLHLRGNISSEGPVSRGSRNVFAPRKPLQNLKPYLFRDLLPAPALNMNRCSLDTTSFRRVSF